MSKKKFSTFAEKYLNGEVLLDEIDDFVDEWHESDLDCEIYEYLGLTQEEYFLWVEEDSVLAYIFEARMKKTPIIKYLEDLYSSPMAARASSAEEASKIKEWLESTGRIK